MKDKKDSNSGGSPTPDGTSTSVSGKNDLPTITPQKDGPYKVQNLEKMTNSRGELIQTKKTMFLCRCGGSKAKPFCDGTHTRIGFSDQKGEGWIPDKRNNYQGKGIMIHDNRGICSHAGHCSGNLPNVFREGPQPWIDPDGAPIEAVRDTIHLCPSSALSYTYEGVEYRDREAEPEIHISRNGPYRVRGGVELVGHELGDGASLEHYTLCRCGQSKTKPRCDGSHWYADFTDDEALTISAAHRAREAVKSEWVHVANPDELSDGEIKALSIGGQSIALSRIGDNYGALDGRCPHQGGPLVDGRIDNGVLRCPWHGHAFDPVSGKALGQDSNVKAYEVEKREDGIYVKIEAVAKPAWTISHVMAETMVNWGIRHVFGMVGHSNLGVAEAIRDQEQAGKLTYIGIRHEGAAAFACSGYAKTCGKPAACLTIAGPGATNLLTGLWDAKMDRVPVLALTGQVNTQFLGPGAFQEIDLPSAFQAVSVFSQTVLPSSDYGGLMSLALKSTIIQRDVSHLIFPNEVQILDAGEEGPGYPDGRLGDTKIVPSEESVKLAMYRMAKAHRPVIIVGYGARLAMDKIIAFAERLNAPVLTTFKGKGQISDFHPLGCGVLGRSGTQIASWFMNNSDLLIVFGASFSHHTGIDQTKPIIQIDFDRMALGKFHAVATPIWGEVEITASLFAERLSERLVCIDCRDEIADHWHAWREEKARRRSKTGDKGLNSAVILDVLSREAPARALISVDVGNNTYSFGRYFESRDHRIIMSGYLGSIGFSFPAAMGAFMAQNERPVLAVSGDGGFAQYMEEFMTAVKYNMNISHILLNNGELGKISKEQKTGGWPVWQTSLRNIGFAEYAGKCGGFGIRVERVEELAGALQEAFNYEGPSLVEIISDPLLI